MKFLEKVAGKIVALSMEDSMKTAVILPNKRSEIFLKNYIQEKLNGPFWLPEFFTVDEFIVKISGKSISDSLLLTFELFKIHKQIETKNQRSFEEFLSWAPIMLSDFNDIDLYLANAESVFKHLSAAKVLEKWNLGQKPLTELQTNYLKFYHSLYGYYFLLKKSLNEKNSGYNGMIYRHVAENMAGIMQNPAWDRFLVVGLNALSQAEKQVFGYLNAHFMVDFLWDADRYFMNRSTENEAGRYIRKMIEDWKIEKPEWIEDHLLDAKGKTINLVEVPKNIGQVKYAGNLVQNLFKNTDGNNEKTLSQIKETALILADENLLVPLLNSLPEIDLGNKEKIAYNITMGYPMKNSPINLFVVQWLELLIRKNENKSHRFNVLNFLTLLQNSTLRFILEKKDYRLIDRFSKEARLSNNNYLAGADILKYFNENKQGTANNLFELILGCPENAFEFIGQLVKFLRMTKHLVRNLGQKDVIVSEQFIALMGIVKKLHSLPIEETENLSLKAIQKIFIQLSLRNEITLRGEPLNGIQVMGMLETRALDFKNIILLSANEGVLPKTETIESFIPFDIRFTFKLPLPKDKTDIFAYHFYRLMQRAENITLVFNSESGQLGGGEPSRYILQIKNELAKVNRSIQVHEQYFSVPAEITTKRNDISIAKNESVMQLVKDKATRGLSPSALNSFIACSLKFYFSQIIKIRPEDSIEENLESDVFGNIVHGVLEEIYNPFVGKHIAGNELEKNLKNLENLMVKQFQEEFRGGNISNGKNLLMAKVAEKFVRQFVEDDVERIQENAPFLLGVEEKKEAEVEVGNFKVKLYGIIDRIEKDELNKTIRIIDYKTGRVDKNELIFKEWETLAEDTKFSKAFQLLFYSYLFSSIHKSNLTLEAGIYSMRNNSSGLLKLSVPEADKKGSLQNFEKILKSVLQNLLDPEQPFQQTNDTDRCKWCDFKSICNR